MRVRERDVVCWNVMIDAYVQNGMPGEGVGLFRRMLREKVRPGEVTVVAVLSGCGQLGALELGRWVHAYVVNGGIGMNLRGKTALVDMYCKCGSLEDATAVFDSIEDKDVVAWNAMIAGFGLHGFGDKTLELFDEICEAGIRLSDITFIGVLNGCANAGLVSQGKGIFHQMNDMYGIKPKAEHYGCMVNLLSRAGLVQEAYELVKNMDVVGTYVLLSNIYAAGGNWDGVKKVGSFMRGRRYRRSPEAAPSK
ncbi:Pentatricopeptide repeat-containing protein [Drosera capensis]